MRRAEVETPTRLGLATDALAIVAIGLLAAWPFGDAYGGTAWLWAVGLGLAFGVGVALLGWRFRLGAWSVTGLLTIVYLLVGPAVAVPDHAAARFLPHPDAIRALLTGIVEAWRDSLTLIAPLGTMGTVLVVPWVTGLVAGVGAATFLWRTRLRWMATVLLAAVFVLAAAFGDSNAEAVTWRGLAIVVALVTWGRWRAMKHVRGRRGRRVAWMAGVVALAGVASIGFTAAIGDDVGQREVLRDHVEPPFDPRDYPSPLSRFRAYSSPQVLKDTTLFTVEGLAPGTRLRLATMDTYDGIVWNVSGGPNSPSDSGTFARLRTRDDDAAESFRVTVDKYSDVWVPTLGDTLDARVLDATGSPDARRTADLLHNAATDTMAQVGRTAEGTTYEFEAIAPPRHSEGEIQAAAAAQGVRLPAATNVPEQVTKRIEQWLTTSGGVAGGELAKFLTDRFREGFFSDGTPDEVGSPAGHGARRLAELMRTKDMVGNEEQYAAAMGVAGQRVGLPTRVVLGFETTESGTIVGDDVIAWTEVALDGLGWVAFEPTPDENRTLKRQDDDPDDEPQPQVLQPPISPEEPDEAGSNLPQGAGERSSNWFWELLAIVGAVLRVVALGLLVTLPLWGIVLFKVLRRRRRRRAEDPSVRLSGGWREVTDRARDFGTSLPWSNTRHENSVLLDDRFPDAGLVPLAVVADRHVFGPVEPDLDTADEYWTRVDEAMGAMRTSVPRWRRVLAWLHPASIPWRHGWESARDRTNEAARGLAAHPRVRQARDAAGSGLTAARQRLRRVRTS